MTSQKEQPTALRSGLTVYKGLPQVSLQSISTTVLFLSPPLSQEEMQAPWAQGLPWGPRKGVAAPRPELGRSGLLSPPLRLPLLEQGS